MLINYYGHSYFLLQGDEYSIALDPFKNVGLIEPKITADYVFKSHDHFDHNNLSLVSGAKLIDKSSGNFEIIQSYHDEVGGKKRGINNVLIKTLLKKLKIATICLFPLAERTRLMKF